MSGTTYVSIGESVAEYLADTVTYTALTVGTNAFYGLVPDEPDELVCVFERPGGSPLMTMTGEGLSQSLLDRPQIQVRVRAAANNYAAANTLMQQVLAALQGLANSEVPSGGLEFLLISMSGSAMYLGQDTRQRPEWSVNLSAIVDNTQRILA